MVGQFFFCIVAECDQELKVDLTKVIIHALGLMAGHIETGLFHHLDRERVDSFRLQSCAVGVEAFAGIFAQKGFCHLAAG
jgi:hypothetical protein